MKHPGDDSNSGISRRLFTFAAPLVFALGHGAAAAADTHTPPTVLFVCQFGTVKSATAREVFRRLSAEQGVPVNVISRGITPQDHASPEFLTRLKADGIDPAKDPLRQLDPAVLGSADIVVVFDALPADLVRTDVQDWSQMPSMLSDYDNARRFLDGRLLRLLSDIRSRRQ